MKILAFRLLRRGEAGNCFKDTFPRADSAGSYWSGCERDWLSHLSFPVLLKLSFVTQLTDMNSDGLVTPGVLLSWRKRKALHIKAFFGDSNKHKTLGSFNRRRKRGLICFSGMINILVDDPGEVGKPPLEVWGL